MKAYDGGEYQAFIDILSRPYEESTRQSILNQSSINNPKEILDLLLGNEEQPSHGFQTGWGGLSIKFNC